MVAQRLRFSLLTMDLLEMRLRVYICNEIITVAMCQSNPVPRPFLGGKECSQAISGRGETVWQPLSMHVQGILETFFPPRNGLGTSGRER